MSFDVGELGVLENMARALGILDSSGGPNTEWFSNPEESLRTILENDAQRNALIAFVDEAMGGADRTTDPTGVIWLPVVALEDPDFTFAFTIDSSPTDGIHIGVGVLVRTAEPSSTSSLSIPLFLAHRENGPAVTSPILLGSPGGRIRVATAISIDSDAPVPGEAHLSAIGLDVDVPTSLTDPKAPVFGLRLEGLQLPGAVQPRDIRVAADGLDELDDAVLDLVLSLVKSQAQGADTNSPLFALAGLLGLLDNDEIPDFPINQLAAQGPHAIATWLLGVLNSSDSSTRWIDYLSRLVGGTAVSDGVTFNIDAARLKVGIRMDTGPTGNSRLTPTISVELGDPDTRVETRADLFQIDLVTGAAIALPQFGVWAAKGNSTNPVLDIADPVTHADTLRLGFSLDLQRRLNFVLAADTVILPGNNKFDTLDLTSPDAVMDAVGKTVSQLAMDLLAGCGDALDLIQLLLGLKPPAGINAIDLTKLMADPVKEVGGYWHKLSESPTAMATVLAALRTAIGDAGVLNEEIQGDGTPGDPWRVLLVEPFYIEVIKNNSILSVSAVLAKSVDTLGQRGTVRTRLAAMLAEIDLEKRSANLLSGIEAVLSAHERGSDPPRISLALDDDVTFTVGGVGVRLGWSPSGGLTANLHAPEPQLTIQGDALPISLPAVAADGSVNFSAEAWDSLESLIGYLGSLTGGFMGDAIDALGWTTDMPDIESETSSGGRLRLADLVDHPETALREWIPQMLMSEIRSHALTVLADLFAGSGDDGGFIEGTGHPDDPYHFAIADGIPNIAIWFPPEGLERHIVAAPEVLQDWRPGDPGLEPEALAACLAAEATVASDIRELIDSRDVANGLAALAQRWAGSDGRIVPPAEAPPGVFIDEAGFAVGQLLEALDLEDLIGRVPTTTVFVGLGANAWLQAPPDRRIDLTAPGLDPAMFSPPAAATGDWFVALGNRAACRPAASTSDGTPEQAARLKRVLDQIAGVSDDIAVVALAEAGHAARIAAQQTDHVTDLITLGTPLTPISLTAIDTQPTADALRLLQRLLPATDEIDLEDPDIEQEDEDLALGRALVAAMMELAQQVDPSADLRPPVVPPEPPREGLTVNSVCGVVSESQVSRAMTAIVAAGLAERARARAETPLPEPTGFHTGLRLVLPDLETGALAIRGEALLTLFAFDKDTDFNTSRILRARLRISDRSGWLTSTPDLELRMVTADLSVPLDGASAGEATVTLHDARVFGQSWERLPLGNTPGGVPLLPEARVLLASAVQRITADTTGTASVALTQLLTALGIIGADQALVGDAFDQLIHDPGGLIRQRLTIAEAGLVDAVTALLGPLGPVVDLKKRTVHIRGGSDTSGRFGWHADVTVSPNSLDGQIRFGSDTISPLTGGLNAVIDLQPLHITLQWHQPSGSTDSVTLWPKPDGAALARMLAKALPGLGGQVAIELIRRTDETVRPVIDALLDSLGLLGDVVEDEERALRPVIGLFTDPVGWFRSSESLAANPAKIQAMFDALQPFLGLTVPPGSPITFAEGVQLSVEADGPGARLNLEVDPSRWTQPNGVTGRMAVGLDTSLTIVPSGPPSLGLDAHVGLIGNTEGRQAVYVQLNGGGTKLFLRPASGGDIPLLPFAGLGALSSAAEKALPFLLNKLAENSGTVGDLVAAVGDALNLRKNDSNNSRVFDGDALHAWALNPSGALSQAVPSIVNTGLATIAPLLDDFVPSSLTVTAPADTLTITQDNVVLAWQPTGGEVKLTGSGVAVPGIEEASFTVRLSADGLSEINVTAGPASIDTGGVILQPFVTVAAGESPAGGRRIAVGLAADPEHRFAARWLLDTGEFALVASDNLIANAVESVDLEKVGLRLVEVIADLVAAVAMTKQQVKDLLDLHVVQPTAALPGGTTVRSMLRGVVLEDVENPSGLIDSLFDPLKILDRIKRLIKNIAEAGIEIPVEDLIVKFTKDNNNVFGLDIGLEERYELLNGEIMLWLENDGDWIDDLQPGASGLFVGFLSESLTDFKPGLSVNGLGLRVGKSSGPLLDFGITLESVALHTHIAIDSTGVTGGGVQLQFSNLAVSASGATGSNAIAQGILRDTGPTPPKPSFSPALAIQQHGTGAFTVTLRAGDGDGPWWIAIQKGFGPLYLEQIGFGATMPQGRVERVSLLMDGSVSIFGLTCAVDDLQITYLTADGDIFSPNNWNVDLAGLAVSANMAGVTIVGGLLKQTIDGNIEYLGMLLGRFGVYGITIYGGYAQAQQGNQSFTAFFAVGAVNGPIGGPPAFFLTGIGGGFGINRLLVVPTNLGDFANYPLIKALDIAATPQNPMEQLRALGTFFPISRGTFWFAAGLSFNSFALVDGIAVIAVQIGDGLDINLLGLARMALPRPQAALVSIELALLVRFSSAEGVLWVQGQLTDNSWLLYPDIKLTGGFAYVIWFKGEHRGEFVLTLGGYHPDFHRNGYPVVARLGLRWSFGDSIVVKAGSYFALTSEALMAGGDFEASADFGSAWAEVKFGAHGIIYFDPFHYHVNAYARIAAGITIDTYLFGEVTFSISCGARIDVTGPEFHGTATFDVGPAELTVEFGGSPRVQLNVLGGEAFINKYLEAGAGGGALAHALITSFGALPSKGEESTPDGSAARPFIVVVEFGLTLTSTVPAAKITRTLAKAGATSSHPPSRVLGVAPMGASNVQPAITLTWNRGGIAQEFPFTASARRFGSFPVGIWGPPQDPNNRKVPSGEMIEALNELDLETRADESAGGPPIPYFQVEIGKRKPLPFARREEDVTEVKDQAAEVESLISEPETVKLAFDQARDFLRVSASPTALASLRGERQAPPLLGTLAEGLQKDPVTIVPDVAARPAGKVYDHFVDPPVAVGILTTAPAEVRTASAQRTTVKGSAGALRVAPPTLASVEAKRSRSIPARLVLKEPEAVDTGIRGTVIGNVDVPPSAIAHATPVTVARTGAPGYERLDSFTADLVASQAGVEGRPANRLTAQPTAGASLTPGQVVVLKLPNANADASPEGTRPRLGVSGLPIRVVMFGHGGSVIADRLLGREETTLEIVQGVERIAAIGLGDAQSKNLDAGLLGWYAGLQMPYIGWSTAIAPGCVVHSLGESLRLHRERLEAGWVTGAELARGVSTVTTTFAEAPTTVVIILDDPAAFGNQVGGRQLLLGLDGADRAKDATGEERPPILLVMENRSVLAYDIVPEGEKPVVVTIASELGWSLVGVMGSAAIDANGAIALIASRGLDAALRPLSTNTPGASRLEWQGPTRTTEERRLARAIASGRPPAPILSRKGVSS